MLTCMMIIISDSVALDGWPDLPNNSLSENAKCTHTHTDTHTQQAQSQPPPGLFIEHASRVSLAMLRQGGGVVGGAAGLLGEVGHF